VKTSSLLLGGVLILTIGHIGIRVAQAFALGLSWGDLLQTAVIPTVAILACLVAFVAWTSWRERRSEARAKSLAGGTAVVSVEFDGASMSALLRATTERPARPRRLSHVVASAHGLSIWNGSGESPAQLLAAPWLELAIGAERNQIHIRHETGGRSELYKGRVHVDLMRLAGDATEAREAADLLVAANHPEDVGQR
jgi:hypothetical protein